MTVRARMNLPDVQGQVEIITNVMEIDVAHDEGEAWVDVTYLNTETNRLHSKSFSVNIWDFEITSY